MWPFSNRKSSSLPPADHSLPPVLERLTHHVAADIELMGSAAVVTVTLEEFCGQTGIESMSDLLETLSRSGASHYVLDLQNVRFMDSAAVGKLVEAMNALSRSGGRIALVNPGQGVAYMFKLTRLDRIFPMCRDVMSALNIVERGAA